MLLVGAAFLACLPPSADAYFERLAVSSRVYALGGAFVSVADDPSAVVVNPAGLARVPTLSVLSTISEPYGLSDLSEYFFAVAYPTEIGAFGVSWHRFGLDGATSEDLFTVAFGRDLVRTWQDASLSVGASFDVARVGYADPMAGSATVLTGALAVLLRPFPFIGAGYTVRNLGEPSFDFDTLVGAGGTSVGATKLRTTHTFGFAYRWEDLFSLLYERDREQDGDWTDRIGFELNAGSHVRVRSGLAGDDVAGGVGVSWSNVTIDAGVTSHRVLGLSYLVSVGLSLPWESEEKDEGW